jgi:hypothetical protein
VLGQLRKRAVGPELIVYVLYTRRKKDASFQKGVWLLARRTPLQTMEADDVIAFAVEDAMIRG